MLIGNGCGKRLCELIYNKGFIIPKIHTNASFVVVVVKINLVSHSFVVVFFFSFLFLIEINLIKKMKKI